MARIGDLEFLPLQFDKQGAVTTPAQAQAILDSIDDNGITDLFVASHGWKNDAGDAMSLYKALFGNVSAILAARGGGRKAAVVGIFWPSKPRYQDYGSLTRPAGAAAGGGGAASVGGAASAGPGAGGSAEAIRAKLEEFKLLFAEDADRDSIYAKIDAAAAKADSIKDSTAAQNEFVDLLRSVVSAEPTAPEEDSSSQLLGSPGSAVLAALQQPTLQAPKARAGTGGATSIPSSGGPPPAFGSGGAASFLGGIRSAALKLVDQLSYYEMKERAGTVGTGLNAVLARVRAGRRGLRIHLVGHSFGARLVTSAARGPADVAPSSLALLQAAFSHNSFSANYRNTGKSGFFRSVVANGAVRGPIVITHTVNDDAVGVAYPIASKLAGQQASSVGGPDDIFGGLGRNGAIDTAEAEQSTMVDGAGSYRFDSPGKRIYNLLADAFIQDRDGNDAHGDVTSPAVANVVASAAGF